jgi:hypothetical protein
MPQHTSANIIIITKNPFVTSSGRYSHLFLIFQTHYPNLISCITEAEKLVVSVAVSIVEVRSVEDFRKGKRSVYRAEKRRLKK